MPDLGSRSAIQTGASVYVLRQSDTMPGHKRQNQNKHACQAAVSAMQSFQTSDRRFQPNHGLRSYNTSASRRVHCKHPPRKLRPCIAPCGKQKALTHAYVQESACAATVKNPSRMYPTRARDAPRQPSQEQCDWQLLRCAPRRLWRHAEAIRL